MLNSPRISSAGLSICYNLARWCVIEASIIVRRWRTNVTIRIRVSGSDCISRFPNVLGRVYGQDNGEIVGRKPQRILVHNHEGDSEIRWDPFLHPCRQGSESIDVRHLYVSGDSWTAIWRQLFPTRKIRIYKRYFISDGYTLDQFLSEKNNPSLTIATYCKIKWQ